MNPAAVELLILDVDGVLTDGSIIVDEDGRELKRFHVRDGFAIKLWQKMGFQIAIISGRDCRAVQHRLDDLAITLVTQGSQDKAIALAELTRKSGVQPDRMAALGDDWPDLPILRRVAYPMAVADAEPAVRSAAAFITPRPGGRGAVRDAIEHLLNAKGLLAQALELHDTATTPTPSNGARR